MSVVSDSVRPHRRQPTRLPHPWDSPGKNTGEGCHFLLQCMKVKSEVKSLSCVRLLATPWTAALQALPSMGFSRQEYWSGVPLPSPSAVLSLTILIYLCLAVLGLHCCAWAFSGCGKQGCSSLWWRLLPAVSPPVEHRLWVCGLQQVQHADSVLVARGLSRSVACGIPPDQGSNPCPMQWRADSQPLCHQGNPSLTIIIRFCTKARSYQWIFMK